MLFLEHIHRFAIKTTNGIQVTVTGATAIPTAKVIPIASALVLSLTAPPVHLDSRTAVDYIFEPTMMPGGILAPRLGSIFGSGPGAGMALLYVITSFCLILVGIGGYAFPTLCNVEEIVPNHDKPLCS